MALKAIGGGATAWPSVLGIGTTVSSAISGTASYGPFVQIVASQSASTYVTSIMVRGTPGGASPDYAVVQIGTSTAGAETGRGAYKSHTFQGIEGDYHAVMRIDPWLLISANTRVAAQIADGTASGIGWSITMAVITQTAVEEDDDYNETGNVTLWNGTAVTARDIGASVLLSPGSGTGQVSLTGGGVTMALGSGTGQVSLASGRFIVGTMDDKTSYSPATGSGAGQIELISGGVLLTNGSATGMIILTSGALTAGAMSDKTSYALTTSYDAGLSAVNAAQVKNEVVSALTVDTYAEISQVSTEATTTLGFMLRFLYKMSRNRLIRDTAAISLYANDDTTVDQRASATQTATSFEHNVFSAGP